MKQSRNKKNRQKSEKCERTLKGDNRIFVAAILPKTNGNTYITWISPYVMAVTEEQLNELESTKVVIRWKKPVTLFFTLDPEEVEDSQDIGCNNGDNQITVEMLFNSKMT